MRDADYHLVKLAKRQKPFAQQAVIATEVSQLHADRIRGFQQLAQAHGFDIPAVPHAVAGMQRRVVARHPRTEADQQAVQGPSSRCDADQTHLRAAQFASHPHAV